MTSFVEVFREHVKAHNLVLVSEYRSGLPKSHPAHKDRMQVYLSNGRTFVVQHWGDEGWELYIPACAKNEIKPTMEALVAYISAGETPVYAEL